MKLVDIAEFYSDQGGGVRTYIQQKLAAAKVAGHDCLIIAPGPETREEQRDGGRIQWVEAPPIPVDKRYHLFWKAEEIHRILEREQPDVVEGSSPWRGGWIAATWQDKRPRPAIKSFFFHQDPVAVYPHTFLDRFMSTDSVDALFFWFWAYLRKLGRKFDTTIVAGDWLAERLQQHGLGNAHAIPLGIDASAFSPDKGSEELRRELLKKCGISDPDGKLFISVSRHHPEKRIGCLIRAIDRVNRVRPVGLYLIGDGPARTSVDRLARRHKGTCVAGFTKDRDQLARILASADGMLHGSAAETYGLVIAEGLCAGLPLVVPNLGGAADLARPDYAEFYKAGDVAGCTDALHRFLLRDPATMRQAAGEAAKQKVIPPEEHFRRLFAHYEQLIKKKRDPAEHD
ncbi:glycosyltransferase [Emcibacter nanhaiensis]|uniref:Glycosyltransferase family 1 protein n=1 Tax=Emcibacter nanhaiensis TaxID=1505037 RepID=A0A501PMW8_9PROT|nr:glycosyltransferase [Emcibacter nanhaiensis]TPD61452.1 glycosyltransferase family 1 protein [Emcibacter nanhaiensis]